MKIYDIHRIYVFLINVFVVPSKYVLRTLEKLMGWNIDL